jgi:hypothetical protein
MLKEYEYFHLQDPIVLLYIWILKKVVVEFIISSYMSEFLIFWGELELG